MSGTDIDRTDVIEAELVPLTTTVRAPALYDPEHAAVLAAMDAVADEHLDDIRPRKTKTGYARDWQLWTEYHAWLAEATGVVLPLTAVTKGTLVGFVVWLDTVELAAPNTIDRRITGVTVEARARGTEVPKAVTLAARQALKPIKNDRAKQARGRGQAAAATPEHLRAMNAADRLVPRAEGSRRRRHVYELPELAVYRNRSLCTMEFGIAGRAEEVSALDDTDIVLVAEGLEVHVPSVKGRPARDVEIAYGEHPDSCPVLNWLAWRGAAGIDGGPAYRSVDQWGNLGTGRLSADGCRLAITRAGAHAGIQTKLTGHSMRAGFLTTGSKAGKRADQLRQQSGHSATSAVFWEYIRKGARWEETASKGIGL